MVDGLKNELICQGEKAKELFGFSTISYKEALKIALRQNKEGKTETIWFNSYSSGSSNKKLPVHLIQVEGMIIEKRELALNATSEITFNILTSLGGKNGWYANILWKIRGYIDLAFGGVGLRRGRRSQNELITGDPLDFWRVEAVEKNKLLRLRAEMKLPGDAWLQFQTKDTNNKKSVLTQTAFFEPKGLWGLLYWYALYPLHGLIFRGMIRSIKMKAENTY